MEACSSVYSVSLKLIGEMSQLPDSQKIFGSLCYIYADAFGNDNVTGFVSDVKNKKIDFALSNVLPKDHLPTPKSYILRKNSVNKGEDKSVYQALKKCDFATQEIIKSFIRSPEKIVNNSSSCLYLKTDQQTHNNTERDESETFSVFRTICLNSKNDAIKDFEFLIRCDSSNSHCARILTLLKKHTLLTLGRRSSEGYNLFEITSNSPQKREDLSYNDNDEVFLNLGMILPQHIHYSYSSNKNIYPSLDIFTSERRPYMPSGSQKWSGQDHQGWFISFIASGSVVVANSSADKRVLLPEMTKCIYCKDADGKDDKSRILFGNGFLLPIESWCLE